jgi:hypothetical protein
MCSVISRRAPSASSSAIASVISRCCSTERAGPPGNWKTVPKV